MTTTAVFDEETNEWVLNGEKIFITSGKLSLEESNGLVIVWAMVIKEAGRADQAICCRGQFAGVSIGKVEIKHGIRTSDTVTIVLNNARIPVDNILGSAEVQASRQDKGFKVRWRRLTPAARWLPPAPWCGRAALEFVKENWRKKGGNSVWPAIPPAHYCPA
ncbi:MAG: acyl-CoA dehydrogenase family protein [Anaerolineaceae bacterium]|nr:acyl-CoA dehydrogenase family protein [Anaerolineaceae bacterium]